LINISEVPTYHALVELSNGELTGCVQKALENLTAAKQNGDDTADCEKIYWAFQEERLKRVNFGNKQRMTLPPLNLEASRSLDQNG